MFQKLAVFINWKDLEKLSIYALYSFGICRITKKSICSGLELHRSDNNRYCCIEYIHNFQNDLFLSLSLLQIIAMTRVYNTKKPDLFDTYKGGDYGFEDTAVLKLEL